MKEEITLAGFFWAAKRLFYLLQRLVTALAFNSANAALGVIRAFNNRAMSQNLFFHSLK
jgi:hypothetical protein